MILNDKVDTRACSEALQLLRRSLELLDQIEAPAEIGAHVDLAICRLEAQLAQRTGEPMQSSSKPELCKSSREPLSV
jgi:hypothetical protein